jgi:hypothetical protein
LTQVNIHKGLLRRKHSRKWSYQLSQATSLCSLLSRKKELHEMKKTKQTTNDSTSSNSTNIQTSTIDNIECGTTN